MPRGGTRAGAGRPPDPNSLRQAKAAERQAALDRPEAYGEWTELPAKGRTGRVPAWPLPTSTNAAEREQWKRLWKTPQALMWEKLGQQVQVALYVRRLVEVEERGASASLVNAVLRMEDSLGLSLSGMRSLYWRIVDREAVAHRATDAAKPAKKKPSRRSSRDRLTVVRGDG